MLDAILREAAAASFDFRQFANPADPLAEKFEEWVPYYGLKFAIAKVLQPASILELGVRFGYSARTFLAAAPTAKFTGIDIDSAEFGGEKNAIEWARQITRDYDANFIVGDTQQMSHWPGERYDLVHVDAQQDGKGTFHDLHLSSMQARWALVDGYFWTRENFTNANDFLLKYQSVIAYAAVIPGYAGELLIRFRDDVVAAAAATDSSAIVGLYDENYYLNDCGGYDAFRRSGGTEISDPRMVAVLRLAQLARGDRAFDIGCGRGEIAYQLARRGMHVTAVDYAPSSIQLTQSIFEGREAALRERVQFVCADVTKFQPTENFDVAIAADVIEHLNAEELERLYRIVSAGLTPDGVFIIHTYPNEWFYERHYERTRKDVEKLSGTMPAQPRSRYELLMHINEQSPARLRRQLRKQFEHVHVWVAKRDGLPTRIRRHCSISELSSSPEVYALASHSPLQLDRVEELLVQMNLSDAALQRIELQIEDCPQEFAAGQSFAASVLLINGSDEMLASMPPHPVHLTYHWFDRASGEVVVFDGIRTRLPLSAAVGGAVSIVASVRAPDEPGSYRLSMTLVQEGVRWLDEFVRADVDVSVRP